MKYSPARIGNVLARRAQRFADGWAREFWHSAPLTETPRADAKTYIDLWEAERKNSYPEIDAYEKETRFAVDSDWFHGLALHTQIVIKQSPLCYQHGRVLYSALRSYIVDVNPHNVTILETGTARGFSATVMAKALADGEAVGKIITFDLLPHDTHLLWNCIDDHEGPKTRRELLSKWATLIDPSLIFVESDSRIGLDRIATGRIGFAFLDGAHTYRDVMGEFNSVQERQKPGDVIVFDDYSPEVFEGLVRAVDEGCERWHYDKKLLRSGGRRAYVVARRR
jgi:predicted O-methyltransferase YrrM